MNIGIRQAVGSAALALGIIVTAGAAAAQPIGLLNGNLKYSSGQTVQPIFEGWTRNADGSYEFHFGYLNRNHVEELGVPVGDDNRIEPGGPDRGQPTYFYTRFNRQLFSVRVPADWGQKELIWTLVTNGQAERAVAWLRPDWEIAPPGTRPGRDEGENQPPTLAVTGASQLALAETMTLTATVADDGRPKPRDAAGRGRTRPPGPPAFDYESKLPPPVNVPDVERPARPRVEDRLQVEWFVWRGPAGVSFEPAVAGADKGAAVVTASFSQPGEYVLRARATDGAASVQQELKVVVGATGR